MPNMIILALLFLCTLTADTARHLGEAKQSGDKAYTYFSYGQLMDLYADWQKKYPTILKIYDAHKRYELPIAGDDCRLSSGHKTDCKVFILDITDHQSLPDPGRPEVIFSGELHGNERIGPTAVIEFARMLLENWKLPDSEANPFLKTLVMTRRIIIVPTANAWGYDKNRRDELGNDPNRDFPYDQEPNRCMKTVAGRVFNELWREHIFQLGLTFHAGGQGIIGYEWGDMSHKNNKQYSPDDEAQKQIAQVLTNFAGPWTKESLRKGNFFPTGTINSLVYPVHGGMEDWAYAGSWMNKFQKNVVKPCDPKSHAGYKHSKTKYDDVSLRGFFFLIETSANKNPSENQLGTRESVLKRGGPGLGHIPRNIRLCIAMADLVQPYIVITKFRSGYGGKVVIEWDVGGAIFVDETFAEATEKFSGKTVKSEVKSGPTKWSKENINTLDLKSPYEGRFSAEFKFTDAGSYVFHVECEVDQSWGAKTQRRKYPAIDPQSHVVNARTNKKWRKIGDGHHVVGRKRWRSKTIEVKIDPEDMLLVPDEPDEPEKKQEAVKQASGVKNIDVDSHKEFHVDPASSGSYFNIVWIVVIGTLASLYYVYHSRKRRLEHRYNAVPTKSEMARVVIDTSSDSEDSIPAGLP